MTSQAFSQRLEKRSGERVARSLPVLQGAQRRVSGAGGYGDLQSGISGVLLRRPIAPAHGVDEGRIHHWSRLAAIAPGVVNFLTHAPLSDRIAKFVAGIHPKREILSFARQTSNCGSPNARRATWTSCG